MNGFGSTCTSDIAEIMSLSILNECALRWLVIGADGLIGSALVDMLKSYGVQVAATSRRKGSGLMPLDLAMDSMQWVLPPCDIALLCAGITSMADCEANQEAAACINVDAQLALAERIWDRGGFVVFLSSSSIFDGAREIPSAGTTPPVPMQAYGRQKAAAEAVLREAAAGRGLTIIRPTKILARKMPLLRGWEDSLATGGVIAPHSRRWMAPLHISMATASILNISTTMISGTWHLSAHEDISYADFALRWALASGFPHERVCPQANSDTLPQRTRLNMDLTTRHFGINPFSVDDVVAALAREML